MRPIPRCPPAIGLSADVPEQKVMEPCGVIFAAPYLAAKSEPQDRVSMTGRKFAVSAANPPPKVTVTAEMKM
jgi:hypothetical protein